jgi:hypothetical protein
MQDLLPFRPANETIASRTTLQDLLPFRFSRNPPRLAPIPSACIERKGLGNMSTQDELNTALAAAFPAVPIDRATIHEPTGRWDYYDYVDDLGSLRVR